MRYTRQWARMILALAFAANAAWADEFPPTWTVGQTWTVRVESVAASDNKDEISPGFTEVATKTFLVESEEVVGGATVQVVKITVQGYTAAFFRARFDRDTKTLISVKQVTIKNGREREGTPRFNDLAPGDTYSVPDVWEYILYLLDAPSFPVPNVSEPPTTIYSAGGRTLTQQVTFSGTGTSATVILSLTEAGSTVSRVTTQTWNAGRPWPVLSEQVLHSTVVPAALRIRETLL